MILPMNTHQGTGLIKGHKGKHSGEQRGRDVHVEESKLMMLKRNKKEKECKLVETLAEV